ncbi:MAG: hypothetical protein NTW86_28230, partial [Candidatus Sumerlaeota bacterium]|nr:hypothetical protein [Candidatus Sumerlaeota bacterium]
MKPRRQALPDFLVIPLLYLLAAVCLYGKLILPARPYPVHSLISFDIRNEYYPNLVLISDTLRDGTIPLWNPYEHGGFPLICDPQSQLWFPVTWLVALTVGYSFFVLQTQLWATFAVAGMGGYAFGRALGVRRLAAFALGVGYMGCGLFIGNASHYLGVVSYAIFPFVLACAHRAFVAEGAWRWAVGAGLLFGLEGLGGHPRLLVTGAFNLCLYALLLGVFGVVRQRSGWLRMLAGLAILFAVFASTAAIQWVPVLSSARDLCERRLSAEGALLSAYEPAYLATMVAPSLQLPFFGPSSLDLTMRNAYVSPALLVAALLAWALRRQARLATCLLCFGVVNFLLSVGPWSFVFGLFYTLAPLFDYFRRPSSAFRGYWMLAATGLGAMGLNAAA